MKQLGLILSVLLFCFIGHSQPYGNEWINYNQRYLKIPIKTDGLYRVNYTELNQALSNIGVALNSVDPRTIQVFSKGQEEFIFIEGESDGKFDTTDYLLFYGKHNDGWFDKGLYIKPEHQVNPYFSLINDTAWYYITFSGTQSSKRFKKINNTNFTGKTVAPYVYKEASNMPIGEYNEGTKDGAGVSSPLYQEGEGWTGPSFFTNKTRTYFLECRYAASASGTPLPIVTSNTVSKSNAAGSPNHGLYIQYKTSGTTRANAVDTSYDGYKMIKHSFNVPISYLSSYTLFYFVKKPLTPEPPSDFQAAAFLRIKYAHALELTLYNSLYFNLLDNIDSTYFRFIGAKTGYYPYAFDLEKGWMCQAVQSGGNLEFIIPPGNERPIVISKEIKTVKTILPSYSRQRGKGWMTDFSILNTDSAFLIIANKKLWSSANQYQTYRSSKGHNAVLVDVEDLYEQFSYGITKHPLSIRNFIRYQLAKGNNNPAYLFLFGKSVKENEIRKYPNSNFINLLPTIGVPPADNIYSIPKLNNVSFTPDIPTGRLAAFDNQMALDYLDKIVDFEKEVVRNSPLIEEKAWRKRGIHFAGGSDVNQQKIFSFYLENYQRTWESPLLGGDIKTFKRFSSGSVQSIGFDSVKYWMDNGVSLLSFFGHGSGGQLGINIGEPSDYNNAGKYPIFIANSCNVGDFHLPNTNANTVNEKWVLAPKGGVIGFIATTSAGFASPLNTWSNRFYNDFSKDLYGKSIGTIMQSTINKIEGQSDFVNRVCMEMNLHGDPSLVFYKYKKPDFAIEKTDIQAPTFVSVDQRFIHINYTIHNLGMGVDTLIPIYLKRKFPSGADTIYVDTIKGISNIFTNSISIFISDQKSVGENKFSIQIDPNNVIDEIYPFVNNTSPEIKVNVTSNDLVPVFPSNYSIQPSTSIILSASTSDPNSISRTYKFEIDVSDSYNTSQRKFGTVTAAGGLIQWSPNLGSIQDSTVFFWKCTPFDGNPINNKWREFSFQYIPNETGWSQYDFNQYKNNTFSGLNYDKTNQKFEFLNGSNNIQAFNQGNPSSLAEYNSIKWSINGNQEGRVSICRGYQSMFISVIDPRTMESWETRWKDGSTIINPNNNFGNVNDFANGTCPQRDKRFQFLVSDSAMMDSMIWMVNQMVPDSFYILVMSAYNAHFQDTNYWKNRHYKAFEDLGADSIRTLASDVPYILLAQKGNKNKAVEVIGGHRKAGISLSEFIYTKINEAKMTGVPILNSPNYKSLHWFYKTQNKEDSIALTLMATDKKGDRIELLKIKNNTFSIPDLKTRVPNINDMKDLQLIANFKDSLAQGAPQLKNWLLLSDETLELALYPDYKFSFHKDTLTQGEELKLEVGLKNLSSSNADSIAIRFLIVNNLGKVISSKIEKTAALKGNDSLIITYNLNTDDLSGKYSLLIDVNPEDTLWQNEGYHFNNINNFNFYVNGDITNPLLDVTFDGVHILDGDIVSAKPEILISLADENKFKPINDTSSFEVYLKSPASIKKRVYFSNTSTDYQMEFIPGNSSANKAEVRFTPQLLEDGDYILEVEAKDASQNQSGINKYKSRFEVVNKSTVTEILNYPNPFSTSTKFVFTLTGYEVPEYFRIQILTATGVVVREIDRDELGSIHIGRNITDYSWNGRDQYGDQLANGVYFYRVIIKLNGQEIEKRNTAADSYFKKGFGKMYLLR